MSLPPLTQPQIKQIARILGDTNSGFNGSELEHHLAQCSIPDPDPSLTKWKRLYNASCVTTNTTHSTNGVYSFIKHCFGGFPRLVGEQ